MEHEAEREGGEQGIVENGFEKGQDPRRRNPGFHLGRGRLNALLLTVDIQQRHAWNNPRFSPCLRTR
jgi:hypothetical protein